MSQRLVRRVCPYCRRPYAPTPEEQAALGLPAGDVLFYRGVGCGECFGTGYRGRTGAFEILPVTPDIRRAIHKRSLEKLEAAIASSGFRPMMEDCRRLVLSGVTTAEEIHRVLGG